MNYNVAVVAGDGVGPEVVAEGIRVLETVGKKYGHRFQWQHGIIGGAAIDQFGVALPDDVVPMCRKSDAVLLGAVGGPKWDSPNAAVRPEQALLGLRKALGLFANIRPVKIYPQLIGASTLKASVLQGTDLVVVRELTGGIYFGKPSRRTQTARGWKVVDTLAYTEKEIRRVVHVGFQLARLRRNKLTSVDKANVIESSRLWRMLVNDIAPSYPDVQLEHVLVDTAAMRLVQRPTAFDVIVTENMFGDILTDEAAVLAGSMGMLPSASLTGLTRPEGSRQRSLMGLYEPIHGSAPDIAGQAKANPLATILSCALMLRYSFGLEREAQAVETAVERAIEDGYRTADIADEGARKILGTTDMGSLIAETVARGK